jgi:hypothetical protein
MSDTVILKDGKELIGFSNISISEIDNKIFINNTSQVEESIQGSLAMYVSDGTHLAGSGVHCTWDKGDFMLTVLNLKTGNLGSKEISAEKIITEDIKSKDVLSEAVVSSTIKCDYSLTNKAAINNWLGFYSEQVPGTVPFKLAVDFNPRTNKEVLLFTSNDYSPDVKPSLIMGIEDKRMYINGLNLLPKTISTSVGEEGDLKGDIAVDENFLYVCVNDFDGKSKIWKRSKLESW